MGMIVKLVNITLLAAFFFSQTPEWRAECSDELKAAACGITVEEFDLLSRVVEAESDRGTSEDSFEGRTLIALTVLNRVSSADFPDSIYGVCHQSGQFAVVSSGAIYSIRRTDLSDEAVVEAFRRVIEGNYPNVMYFNNSCYQYGSAYGVYGGNYFVTVEE